MKDWTGDQTRMWLSEVAEFTEDILVLFKDVDGKSLENLDTKDKVRSKHQDWPAYLQMIFPILVKDLQQQQERHIATDALIKELKEAAGKLNLVVEQSGGKTKYGSDKVVLGLPKVAALGIAYFVNNKGGMPELQKRAGGSLEAIREEILSNGTKSDIECMNYILEEPAGSNKKKFQNGWMRDCKVDVVRVDEPLTLQGGIVVAKGVEGKVLKVEKDGDTWPDPPSWGRARIDFGGSIGEHWVSKDQFQNLAGVVLPHLEIADPGAPDGKRGMLFKDFCEHKVAKSCNLTPAQVFVLRFYTTWGFVSINSPLRDPELMDRKISHKLAVTVYMLDMAIKQCRGVAAESPGANVPLSLFRGIGKRKMDPKFMKEGGTELAPMSTVRKFCNPPHDMHVRTPTSLTRCCHMWC